MVRGRYRAGTRRVRREQAAAPPEPTADSFDLVHQDQAAELVRRALDDLDEPYRSAVRLRYVDDRSIAEIAAAQGVPVGTAGWRVSEGLKRLRDRLDRDAGGDARPWLMALCPGVALSGHPTAASAATAHGGMSMSKIGIVLLLAICASPLVIDHPWSAAADHAAPPEVDRTPASSPTAPHPFGATALARAGDATAASGGGSRTLAVSAAGSRDSTSLFGYQLTFAVAGGGDADVPRDMLTDIPESGSLLIECMDAYFERSRVASRIASATVRLTLVQDADQGVIVADSALLADRSTIDDAELRDCVEAGSFSMKIDKPIGPPGTHLEVDVGITHDPSRMAEEERAATAACFDDVKRRRPDISLAGKIDDAEFARCMDAAMEVPPFGLSTDQTAGLAACLRAVESRHPDRDPNALFRDEEFVRCTKKIIGP